MCPSQGTGTCPGASPVCPAWQHPGTGCHGQLGNTPGAKNLNVKVQAGAFPVLPDIPQVPPGMAVAPSIPWGMPINLRACRRA